MNTKRTVSALLIEDDSGHAELLANILGQAGISCTWVTTGPKGLQQAARSVPDIIILDLGLPGMSGFEVCEAVRRDERLARVPILVLSGLGEENDIVRALDLGASSYIVKPARPRELVARLHAILRGTQPEDARQATEVGPFQFDPSHRVLHLSGKYVPLSSLEFRLLHFLALHANRIFSRNKLLEEVWGHDHEVAPRIVDTYIYNLREKLEQDPTKPRYLKNLRGRGYIFDLDGLLNESPTET